MFRSEWIKDAKFKRWVASDRRELPSERLVPKIAKAKVQSIMSRGVTGTFVSLTLTESQSQFL